MSVPSRSSESAHRSGFVALVGWTNVGKSTLLNRLIGEKVAAVADVPQTTRNRITGVLNLPGRAQVGFVDTPGFHRPRHRMNRQMVEIARDAVAGVDVLVLVVDAAKGLGPGDHEIAQSVRNAGKPSLAALNKIDQVRPKNRLLPLMETLVREWGLEEAVPVSALTGEGCDELLETILHRLPEGPPWFPEDQWTDMPERALAAEWIREKLFHLTRQEIPHSVAVIVDRWHEREDGRVEIDATILVEKPSQKAIVIGREGRLLKQVGIAARHDLERLLGARVTLRLWVKVRRNWRDDPRVLRELGLL